MGGDGDSEECESDQRGKETASFSCLSPLIALDTHSRCAGHSMRQQGYGVSGWGVGPRRGLPWVHRA